MNFLAKTGGIVQSRGYSQRVFSDFTGCDLTEKRIEVPEDNNSFHVRLRLGETKDSSFFLKGGLR